MVVINRKGMTSRVTGQSGPGARLARSASSTVQYAARVTWDISRFLRSEPIQIPTHNSSLRFRTSFVLMSSSSTLA